MMQPFQIAIGGKRHFPLAAGLLAALFLLIFTPAAASLAQAGVTVAQDQAEIQFPDSITFSVELHSQAEIQEVTLVYRVQQVACGEVVAKAFPQFTPGKEVAAAWTWEMRQSGSLPPGAKIYWQWQATDAAGNSLATQVQTIIWLDSTHAWQTLSGENVNLHWYNGSTAFGQELLGAALTALDNLERETGLKPEKPIDLYIYANSDDLRAAILYEPGWAGGQAFAEHDIVIIGISAGQIEWGKGAIAHELTHVLVGHLTFSCLGYMPGWLVEGLAMYGEGGLDDFSTARFEQAVKDNELISVRALSGAFSENPDKADISYSESYSLVNFLIDAYGKEQMLALLQALKEGATVDAALETVYGFDIDGLEDAWREKIGAQARQETPGEETAISAPTEVPTIVPVAGIARTATASATPPAPTVTPQAPVQPTQTSSPPPATVPPSATERPSPTVTKANPTPTAPTRLSRPSPTQPPQPEAASPSWLSGTIRVFTSGCLACLILAGIGSLFFFAVIRPPRRRRKP